MTAEKLTTAVQDYLKAIHALGGAEQMVSPVDIAARLQVRAPSVTGMLKRLKDCILVLVQTLLFGSSSVVIFSM